MWWSPGILAGGVFLLVALKYLGGITPLWLCVAVFGGILIDVLLGIVRKPAPRIKTRDIYTRR